MTARSDENKPLALLAAIAAGDAEISDGVAELRKDGIVSTGDLLSALSEGLRAVQDSGQPLNFRHLSRETPRDLTSAVVQRTPKVPFVLNGAMYDPEDITRFNGHELHFIASANSDHMVVLDDRELFATWRQLTYIELYRHGGSPSRVESRSLNEVLLGPPNPLTGFNEHINFEGAWKNLRKGRGYRDLGSWSDEISSFKMVGTQVTELYEHEDYLGETFTRVLAYSPTGDTYFEERNLHMYGWGDRASSVGTW